MDLFTDDSTVATQTNTESSMVNTPVRTANLSEEEDSPYFPSCTQETQEDVDVLWDWNSPQSKPKNAIKRRSRKKLNLQVPKVPLRRHLSGNSQQLKNDFEKLKEDMRILKAEIAKPDHEESLILSPREEEAFKNESVPVPTFMEEFSTYEGIMEEEHHKQATKCNLDNIFNDDLEDQLILCSQRMEIQLSTVPDKSADMFNDSLEKLLEENEDNFDQATQVVTIKPTRDKSKVFPRSHSENSVPQVSKFEWHRTQSFENYDATISKDLMEVIEKKRLEAKAKLEARKYPNTQTTDITDSQMKCSSEEIERKRLQALAKLEAKRQQDIIQKKKQDALKRLEQSRKKNALSVKHSLTKKL